MLMSHVASGFGKAVAQSLLSDGWNVVGIDWNEEGAKEVMKELGFRIYQADVSNYSDVASVFAKTWEQYKRLDFGKCYAQIK